jgi:hypothetical protein
MRQGTIGAVVMAATLVLGGVALAGGVWVSDSGEKHEVGHNAIFLDGDAEAFDLSDLADGETRTFGSGDEQLTATRNGDSVTLDRPARGDEKAITINCELGADSCQVMTFGDDSDKVSVMITKSRTGHGGGLVTIDEDVIGHGDGTATIVIERIGIGGDDPDVRNVWVQAGGPHSHGLVMADGATTHDLSEMFDGETRIFGYGEKQVMAVRDQDEVTLTRDATDEDDAMSVTCTIGRDSCRVLTFEDDPEKVAIVIEKTRRCVNGEGDCDADLLHLEMGHGAGHGVKVIKLRGGDGDVVIEEIEAGKGSSPRVLFISEDDDD